MLSITVPGDEFFDPTLAEFVTHGDVSLELEHSLASLSKWESTFEKPFLGSEEKTPEEILGYIEAMILTPNFPRGISARMSKENLTAINEYIDAKMTATWFPEAPRAPRQAETITSELVYYWMTIFHIPFECEHWHLNRLFTLIRICNAKQSKSKKMSRSEVAARQRQLNAERRQQYGTSG